MKIKKVIVLTRDEIAMLVQDEYNKREGLNHKIELKTILPNTTEFEVTLWDKDEESH